MDAISTKKIIVVAAILAVLCGYTWSLRLRTIPLPPPPRLEEIPRSLGGFHSLEGHIAPGSLDVLGADLTIARSYVDSSETSIELFIGYFAAQQEYSQIHSPKHCYPGAGWDIISEGPIDINMGKSSSRARRLIISNGEHRQLVVYWFSMHDRVIPDEFALKWNQLTSALLARSQAATFIRFSTVIPPGRTDETGKDLVRFVEEISPYILEAISPREKRDGS